MSESTPLTQAITITISPAAPPPDKSDTHAKMKKALMAHLRAKQGPRDRNGIPFTRPTTEPAG